MSEPKHRSGIARAKPAPRGPLADADFVVGGASVTAVAEAGQAGWLDSGAKAHLSVRVPAALFERAREKTGLASPTEVIIAALALAAQSDPVAEFMEAHFGALGPDFDLEY
jgi:hypothetical protein